MEQSTRAILNKVIDLLKTGEHDEAVRLLVGVLKQYPDLETGWYLLGMALEPTDQRIRAFNEVLRINPKNEKARQQLDELTEPQAAGPLPHVSPFFADDELPAPSVGPTPTPVQDSVPQRKPAQQTPRPTASRSGASARVRSAMRQKATAATRQPVPAAGNNKDALERVWKRFLDMRVQLVGGLILLIGFGLTVLLVSSLVKDVPLWIFGRTTDGTITAKTWSDFDITNPDLLNDDLLQIIDLNMQYYFEYEFTTPDGETYYGKSEVTEEEFLGYGEGGQLKVRYSTLNPENSRLDDARLVPFLMCTYSIFMIITLFTLAAGRELVDF